RARPERSRRWSWAPRPGRPRASSVSAPRRTGLDRAGKVGIPADRHRSVRSSAAPRDLMDQRLPNLFVIGAPKAGTTFMHHALDLVPEIYMSRVKEPGFFTSSRDYRLGVDYYVEAYFSHARGFRRRGESTPWYLYSDEARTRIAGLDADESPKFIVLVRRPS